MVAVNNDDSNDPIQSTCLPFVSVTGACVGTVLSCVVRSPTEGSGLGPVLRAPRVLREGPGAGREAPRRHLFLEESTADDPGLWAGVCPPGWTGVAGRLSNPLTVPSTLSVSSLSLSSSLCLLPFLSVCSFSLWGWVGVAGLGSKGCTGGGRGRVCQAEGMRGASPSPRGAVNLETLVTGQGRGLVRTVCSEDPSGCGGTGERGPACGGRTPTCLFVSTPVPQGQLGPCVCPAPAAQYAPLPPSTPNP